MKIWAFAAVWLLASIGVAEAQDAPSADDIAALVEIGHDDRAIVAYCRKHGWPERLTEADLARIREAGAGPTLRSELLLRFRGRSDLQQLAEEFRAFDARPAGGPGFSILVPRTWISESSPDGTRHYFHDHAQNGWFLRQSVFVLIADGRSWKPGNESAVARIAFDAARDALSRGGIRVGTSTDDVVLHQKSGRDFPFVHAVCTHEGTGLRGLVGLSVRIDEATNRVVIVGIVARVGRNAPREGDLRDRVANMLASLRFSGR